MLRTNLERGVCGYVHLAVPDARYEENKPKMARALENWTLACYVDASLICERNPGRYPDLEILIQGQARYGDEV